MHIKNTKSKICAGVVGVFLAVLAIFGVCKLVQLVGATSAGLIGWVSGRTNESIIYYGTTQTSPYTITEDGTYNRLSTHAMCIQPSHLKVVGGGGTITGYSASSFSDVVKIMLATDANYGAASNSSLASSISSQASSISNISPSSGVLTNFAVGHMIVGAMYEGSYYGLNAGDQQILNNIKNDILNWYTTSGNTEWQGYEIMVMSPTGTTTGESANDYQAVAWLEYVGGGGGEDPDPPTPTSGIVINKYDSTDHSKMLSGAGFYLAKYEDKEAGNTSAYRYVTTGSNGSYNYTPTESAWWCVQEITPPSGYVINATYQNYWKCLLVEVSAGETAEYNFYDDPITPTPTTGTIKIYKEDESGNGLTGAKFYLATESDKNSGNTSAYQVIDMTSTDEITISNVEEGTWCVLETDAPSGYLKDASWHCNGLGSGGTLAFHIENTLIPEVSGSLKIKKVDADTGTTTPSGEASLAGAVFQVQKCTSATSCTNYNTMTIGSDGTATLNGLPEGDYKVYEKTAGTGYVLNSSDVRTFSITASGYNIDLSSSPFSNTVIKGGISITKQRKIYDNNMSLQTENFANVSFDIYNSNNTKVKTIITGTNGIASTGSTELPYGTYTIKEVSNSYNVAFDVVSDQTVSIVTNGVVVNAGTVIDNLLDTPTVATTAREASSSAESPVRTLGITTNASIVDRVMYGNTLTTGLNYKVCGEVYVVSSRTLLTSTPSCVSWTQTAGKTEVEVPFSGIDTTRAIGDSVSIIQKLYVINGSEELLLAIHNADLNDANETLTVEGVGIATSVSSGRSDSKRVTPGIVTITDTITAMGLEKNKSYYLRASLVDGSGNAVSLVNGDSDSGQRRTVSYTMTAETGVTVYPTVEIEFNASSYIGQNLTVYEELYDNDMNKLAEHKVLADEDQTISVLTPTIATVAWRTGAINNSKSIYVSTEAGVSDVVTMTGLTSGASYILKGEIYQINDDGTLGSKIATSADTAFTVGSGTENATATVDFVLNTTGLIGKKLVVYEYLYYGSTKIAEHTELTDNDQIIEVGSLSIATEAWRTSAIGENKNIYVDTDAQVSDVVTMTGLAPSTSYILKGEIYVLNVNGEEVTLGEKIVTQSDSFATGATVTGAIQETMNFALDTTNLIGKQLIVYEYLYIGETLIAEHTEITDVNQIVTVMTPGIATVAKDASDGDGVIESASGQTIRDVVSYENLRPGDYYLCGILMDKNTGNVLKVGGVEVAEKCAVVTASNETGTFTMDFAVDASELPGASVVVFESLYLDNTKTKMVADHKNLSDGNQTVKVRSRIGTKAVDDYDGDQKVGVGDAMIVDTVEYEGLGVGTYTMKGELMNVDGLTATSTGVKAEVTFEIKNEDLVNGLASGEVEMGFEINTKEYVGHKLVVFEELVTGTGDDEATVAEHKDKNDEDQTVMVMEPMVETTATDALDEDKELSPNTKAKIRDRVAYTGLVPGTTYTLKGILMDKKTGKVLLLGNGKEAEEVAMAFTPDRDEGVVRMEFEIPTVTLDDKEIVVFETLYIGEETDDGEKLTDDDIIAMHKDINDEKQTVVVGKTPKVPDTGLNGREQNGIGTDSNVIILVLGIVGIGVMVVWCARMRKNKVDLIVRK